MGAVETLICWENLDIQRVGLASILNFEIFRLLGLSSRRKRSNIVVSPSGDTEEPRQRRGEDPLLELGARERQDPLH